MSLNKALLSEIMKNLEKSRGFKRPHNQWQDPGEITEIPSRNITMEGVGFPVLGVGGDGYAQMMYPDMHYQFPVGPVTEYPFMHKAQKGGEYVDSVLNANNNLDWVKRLYEPNTPSMKIKGQKGRSTHFMESADNRVYPTIVKMPDGRLKYLGSDAYDYADRTNTFIPFPNEGDARWFAQNYKKGSGVLERFQPGGEKKEYTGESIVDFLATRGYRGGKKFRKDLAQEYGVENYDYSAKKNIELLNRIRENDAILLEQEQNMAPMTPNSLNKVERKRNPDVYRKQLVRDARFPFLNSPVVYNGLNVETPTLGPNASYEGMSMIPKVDYRNLKPSKKTQSVSSQEQPPVVNTPAENQPAVNPITKDTPTPSGMMYNPLVDLGTYSQPRPSISDKPWYENAANLLSSAWDNLGNTVGSWYDNFENAVNANPYLRGSAMNFGPAGNTPEGAKGMTRDVVVGAAGLLSNQKRMLADNYFKRQDLKNDDKLQETQTKFTIPLTAVKPDIVTGDTINISKDNIDDRYIIPGMTNLNNTRWGYRNRGDFRDIQTEGADLTLFNDLVPAAQYFKNNPKDPESASYIGLTPDGQILAGNKSDFANSNALVSRTFSNKIVDFPRGADGKLLLKNSSSKASNKHLSPLITVIDDNGNTKQGSMNFLIPKNNQDRNSFGDITGGRVIFKAPDGQMRLAMGSADNIARVFDEFKKEGNYPYLTAFTNDNGAYGPGLRTKSGKITAADLKKYQGANTTGSVFMYMLPGDYNRGANTKPKFREVQMSTPNVRTEKDESFRKGHPLKNSQEAVVLHHTGYSDTTGVSKGMSAAMKGVADQFSKPGESSHVVIDFDGTRYNFAKPDQVTFHAGKSMMRGRSNVNDFGIGVEFQGDTGNKPLTDLQIESFTEYIAPLIRDRKIPLENIITHKQIRDEYIQNNKQDKEVKTKPDVSERDYKRIQEALKKKGIYAYGGQLPRAEDGLNNIYGEDPPKRIDWRSMNVLGRNSGDMASYYPTPAQTFREEEMKRVVNADALRTKYGTIKPGKKQNPISKAMAIVANPGTAAGYVVRGERIPDNFDKGETNNLDIATNIINPFGVINDSYNAAGDVRRGEYSSALLNTIGALPGIPAVPKYAKAALKRYDPLLYDAVKYTLNDRKFLSGVNKAKELAYYGLLDAGSKAAPILTKIPFTNKLYKDLAYKMASKSAGSSSLPLHKILSKKEDFSNYTGGTGPLDLYDRNLLDLYIYGKDKNFRKSKLKPIGLEKYYDRYGDMQVYEMFSDIQSDQPLDISKLGLTNLFHESLDNQKGFDDLLQTLEKRGHLSTPIADRNPVSPIDDVAGHMMYLVGDKNPASHKLISQDIWKFTPEEYANKWGSKNNPSHKYITLKQAQLMDKAGKPFVLMQENPINYTDMMPSNLNQYSSGGEMIRRADGSYSRRGLWDNIRANKGSGKKPTREMLEQERKIRAQEKQFGGTLISDNMYMYNNPFLMQDGGEPDGAMAIGQIDAAIDKLMNLRKFIKPDTDLEPWVSSKLTLMDHYTDAVSDYMQYNPEAQEQGLMEMAQGGGIPQRYKNMGFSKAGVKKKSNRPGKKWMVLAKKGDDYKVVHGGYKGMQDYTQHGSSQRRENFWNRMGGKNSSKAKDPFSPLYWHKRFGTWANGGQIGSDYDMDAYGGGGYVGYDGNRHVSKTPTWSGNMGYQDGGYVKGDELDVTPEQAEMLKAAGYEFEIIQP